MLSYTEGWEEAGRKPFPPRLCYATLQLSCIHSVMQPMRTVHTTVSFEDAVLLGFYGFVVLKYFQVMVRRGVYIVLTEPGLPHPSFHLQLNA